MSRIARTGAAMAIVGAVAAGSGQDRPSPQPRAAVMAITDAFRTHRIVTVTDPHGNEQVQQFLLTLVADASFGQAADDVVLETLSSRYQDAIDRFVRGDELPREVLRLAWEEHTVPNSLGVQAAVVLDAVRSRNTRNTAAGAHQIRVIAGDPPIDWDNVVTPEDHRKWIELRDSYPADLIRRQVLDRGRRALVVYGQGHLQRRQIASNYDMSTWQAQTIVSLLERDAAVRVFNIYTLLDRSVAVPPPMLSWPVPSLAALNNTTLGAEDFSAYYRGLGADSRVGITNGQLTPLPRDRWKPMRMDEQFDALLYLGPPASMTVAPIPRALCSDGRFAAARLERLVRFSPPPEVERFKKECGLP